MPRHAFIPTETEKRIATELRQVREQAGLNQKQLARMIGVTDRTLSRYETLRRAIPTAVLVRIKEHVGVHVGGPLDDLLTKETLMVREPEAQYAGTGSRDGEERRLLEWFRALPRDARDALMGRAVALVEESRSKGTFRPRGPK